MKTKKRVLWLSVVIVVLFGLLGCALWLWYDANVDRSGWQERDGIIIYEDFHGKPVTGWQEIDGQRYYFAEDYSRTTGWLTYGEVRYYLGLDGAMRTGWQEIDDRQYFFDSSGYLYTGWQAIDGNLYYFGDSGELHTGWLELDGKSRYLDENGVLLTHWQDIDGLRYYLGGNGIMQTGWQTIDEARYYLGQDGVMHTGWLEYEDQTLYLNAQGNPIAGWQDIDENTYYFDENGFMHTGWLEEGEYRYYLHEDGAMAVGPTQIGDRTYHFTPKGIYVLLVNPWYPVPEDYEPDLVEIEDGYLVDRSCYDALTQMMADCRAAGLNPSFSSTYRTWADQIRIINNYIALYQEQGNSYETAVALTYQIAAQPGTSEHHLGLAMDIVGGANTPNVHAWLHEHCWEYGFILRYLEGKQSITGYIPESWHFRYVGTEVSMDMKDTGLCLEEYLDAVQ